MQMPKITLLCGTGNKSEILIGYFTKHGDGACDIEPIGDLYKTDVFKLGKYMDVPKRFLKNLHVQDYGTIKPMKMKSE